MAANGSFSSINWSEIWEQCEENRRRRGAGGSGKRSETGTPDISEPEDFLSSYHLLTPKKLQPMESQKQQEAAQKYIHHLESVQTKLNAKKSFSKTGKRRDKKKRLESKSGSLSVNKTISRAIDLGSGKVSADELLDAVFGKEVQSLIESSEAEFVKESNANIVDASDADANVGANDGGKADAATVLRNSAAEGSVSANDNEGIDEEEEDATLTQNNSLITVREVEVCQKCSDVVVTDKDTQATFCAIHNKFLPVKYVTEQEGTIVDRGNLSADLNEADKAGSGRAVMKRKMGLLAASLGNIIMKRQRKSFDGVGQKTIG